MQVYELDKIIFLQYLIKGKILFQEMKNENTFARIKTSRIYSFFLSNAPTAISNKEATMITSRTLLP